MHLPRRTTLVATLGTEELSEWETIIYILFFEVYYIYTYDVHGPLV